MYVYVCVCFLSLGFLLICGGGGFGNYYYLKK